MFTAFVGHEVIDIEDSPEPVPLPTDDTSTALANSNPVAQLSDPKDPEGFFRRCSGYNKKKNVRCSAIIGRNSHHAKNAHSTFLPTCYTHKDQKSHAGWCQFTQKDGERCGRLFRWTPPYLELCAEHQGHPDTPCYFMKLPLELRLEVFRYLLPSRAIGSSTSLLHIEEDPDQQEPWYHSTGPMRAGPSNLSRIAHIARPSSPLDRSTMRSVFPVPLNNLLLISRQMHDEVRDLLYSTVPFTVDVRKDGTFMCGRRLLEPRRADGSSHYLVGDVDKVKERFLKTFNWAAVKNYNVDILVENWKDDTNRGYHTFPWDEEVEIYDIRDYIGVVVSGILSKARNLCRLNVRIGFSKFIWTREELYTNVKTLVGPFERLRNVRQPRFLGVYEGTPQTNFMISLPVTGHAGTALAHTALMTGIGSSNGRPSTPLCSVPQLPTKVSLSICTEPDFVEYRNNWERWLASASSASLVSKPPIRAMFTELKDFYTRLAATVPDVTARNGRHAFLHRARVAREQENVEAFRHLRNELITYWEAYLEQEERKKDDMNRRLGRMLDVDIYPASWDEDHACIIGSSSSVARTGPGSGSQSPTIIDADSWLKAVKRSQPEQSSFANHGRPTSNFSPNPQSHASGARHEEGSSAQDPVIIDLMDDDQYIREKQRVAGMRPRDTVQSINDPKQRYDGLVQSPTSSNDEGSPAISQTALQPSKDQQPMALNPQLHLEAAMSHRRQAEFQAHRARSLQQQQQQQYRRSTVIHAQASPNQSLASPQGESAYAPSPTTASILSMQTQVQASSSSSQADYFPCELLPGFSNQRNLTILDTEAAMNGYEGASLKRAVPEAETEDVVMDTGKKRRVDSGFGWAEDGYAVQGEAEEIAGDAVGEYTHCDGERDAYLGFGEQHRPGWKGKGKMTAEQQERAWN